MWECENCDTINEGINDICSDCGATQEGIVPTTPKRINQEPEEQQTDSAVIRKEVDETTDEGEEVVTNESKWFYEEGGQRKGPVSEDEMIRLIKSSGIAHGSSIWKQGFPDWLNVENTELQIHLDNPPPLSGEYINNTLIWVLAFAPLIGYILQWVVAIAAHGDNQWAAQVAMSNGKYWFVTIGLNIALAYFDEKRLKKAGHNTEKFKGWVWLVPVYLYQRAKYTKQNLAYFIIWIVCFVFVLFD